MSGRTKGHVLVVDDDPMIRDVVSEVLAFGGYSVSTAGSAEEALRSVENDRPGLVLVDAQLPTRRGRSWLREMRRRRPGLSVLVMAGETETRRWASQAGVAGIVARPFGVSELCRAVERWCAVV
jgi:DNA-binding response OmpR family regulator